MAAEAMCYTGHCAGCGSLLAAAVIRPDLRADNAAFVRDLAMRGLHVQTHPVAHVRAAFAFCACGDAGDAPAGEGASRG